MSTKKGDSKQRIIQVSKDLFANKGFSGTSIRDIARAASTTIPNIYYYFGSKEGLYHYVLRDVMARFAASVAGAASGASVREQLITMGKAKHRFIEQNPSIMRLLFREQVGSESGFNLIEEMGPVLSQYMLIMAKMVKQGMDSGELRRIDAKIAARFLLGVFNAYDMEIVSQGRIPSDEEIEEIVDLALEGLRKR